MQTAERAPSAAGGRLIDRAELRRRMQPLPPLRNEPSLDGLRAIAVAMVIVYHAGFSVMHGGFLGVEVFFVVSGYLITSLLRDEEHRDGRISLGHFWQRRARRLLPALAVMLVTVAVLAPFVARDGVATLRRDIVYAVAYLGNWGQIIGKVPYFSPALPLLRHVWSLAVEEQWYLVWPIVFAALMRWSKGRTRLLAGGIAATSLAVMLWSRSLAHSSSSTIDFLAWKPDRFNFLYLGTFTRSSGLLAGAALAMCWRPWRAKAKADAEPRHIPLVDAVGWFALMAIALIAVTREAEILVSPTLYETWLPLVTIASVAVIAAAVHPGAVTLRSLLGSRPLAEIGKRSYGLYLWHWPVFVIAGVRAHHARFWPALLVAVAITEASYRWIETPIRHGALGKLWARAANRPRERRRLTTVVSVAAVLVVVVCAVGLARVPTFDAAKQASAAGDDVVFDLADATTVPPAAAGGDTTPGDTTPGDSAPADTSGGAAVEPSPTEAAAIPAVSTPTTEARLPRRVVIVGDSQAHALSVNLPKGVESTFTVTDGSVDGCSVWSTGQVVTTRPGFRRSFDTCAGWDGKWASAAAKGKAEVALVMLGAWDVFDVKLPEGTVKFASADFDQRFLAQLQTGIDALVAKGVQVGLLEVACMRPVEAKGAAVPPLPERGDDTRVAHVNQLLRKAAAADPAHVTFVTGPTQWCHDDAIATDLGYRWDGVHVYRPGAKLILETIAPELLAIPVPAS